MAVCGHCAFCLQKVHRPFKMFYKQIWTNSLHSYICAQNVSHRTKSPLTFFRLRIDWLYGRLQIHINFTRAAMFPNPHANEMSKMLTSNHTRLTNCWLWKVREALMLHSPRSECFNVCLLVKTDRPALCNLVCVPRSQEGKLRREKKPSSAGDSVAW